MATFTLADDARLFYELTEADTAEYLDECAEELGDDWKGELGFSDDPSNPLKSSVVVRKATRGGKSGDLAAFVTFQGDRPHGTGKRGGKTSIRQGEIAFLNNYGTSRVPKRLWVRKANAKAEDALAKKAENLLDSIATKK